MPAARDLDLSSAACEAEIGRVVERLEARRVLPDAERRRAVAARHQERDELCAKSVCHAHIEIPRAVAAAPAGARRDLAPAAGFDWSWSHELGAGCLSVFPMVPPSVPGPLGRGGWRAASGALLSSASQRSGQGAAAFFAWLRRIIRRAGGAWSPSRRAARAASVGAAADCAAAGRMPGLHPVVCGAHGAGGLVRPDVSRGGKRKLSPPAPKLSPCSQLSPRALPGAVTTEETP